MGASCSIDRHNEEEWCRPRIAQSIKRRNKKKKKKKMDEERRKHLLKSLSAEVQTSELLSRIPGRICNNGSTSSACAFTQQGKKGINQDAMLVWEHYASRTDTLLCGVFDGHGPYGHLVARRVRDTLPTKLMAMWKARMRGDVVDVLDEYEDEDDEDEDEESDIDDGDEKRQQSEHVKHNAKWESQSEHQRTHALGTRVWRECLMRAFRAVDRDLRIQPTIDCFCSGTTAIILLQQGAELIMGNVGDSRAVLATFSHSELTSHESMRSRQHNSSMMPPPTRKLQAIQLTLDLKPNVPREAERIRLCNGRVFAMEDEPEVPRVWLPYDNAPGLAMARAFGDFCLKDYGLISVPDITYRTLTPDDQFVILATDGVWDVMSNSQAVYVVASAPSRVTAARLLVETAVRAWRFKYPTSKVDDCAVVCLFFHREPGTTTTKHRAATSSTYYCTEEDEDNEEEEKIIACVDAPALTPTSPSRHMQQLGTMQPDEVAHMSHSSGEPEEITWNGSSMVHSRVGINRANDMPYQGFFVDSEDASPPSVLEIQEEDMPPSPRMHRKGKEPDGEVSPPRKSLAHYMSSKEDDDDDEWSALEGVVRVNSILNLPRFKVGVEPSTRRPP